LVSDGAWGTLLHKRGLEPGHCAELWCVEHPAEVLDIARRYVEAGADMVKTNSFGGSRFKLEHYGLADRTVELNEAAARLSRQAAGSNAWVIASLGPTGRFLVVGEVTEAQIYEAYTEQSQALERGGADALCIETMLATDEAAIAVRAARQNTHCEIICTFTFEQTAQGGYRTMMGVTPGDAARAAVDAGADIVGTNCGSGIERLVEIVREMRAAVQGVPILVHANAGLPRRVNGVDVFPETPTQMAAQVPAVVAAGASVVGGCCGTTPEHIRAIAAALRALR
jgi:5-methyltetrahydrofolate--homocysteine methyltransferase